MLARKIPLLSLLFLFLPAFACADQSLHGYCAQTATLVLQTGGLTSSPPALGVYPGCSVTVYYAGTTNVAPIFSDNIGTVQLNPFQASTVTGAFIFYAANGRYDVNLSGGAPLAIPTPFTLYDYLLYDLPGLLTSNGCLFSQSGAVTIYPGCQPSGPQGAIQINQTGSFYGSSSLLVSGTGPGTLISLYNLSTTGWSLAQGGFQSGLNSINGFAPISTLTQTGAQLQGLYINAAGSSSVTNAGGYIHMQTLTYNPYNEPATCRDQFGNTVTQPLPLPGDSFVTGAVMWFGPSPLLPSSATANCPTPGGPPLAIDEINGVNLNTYLLAMGGFATTVDAYNSFQSFYGGIAIALGVTMGQADYYAPQTTCGALNPPGGGYGGFGGYVIGSGTIYCYYNPVNSSWNPFNMATGGGGTGCTISGVANEVIYIASGGVTCTSATTFTFNPSTNVVQLGGSGYFAAPAGFNALACPLANCIQAPDGGGLFGKPVTAEAFYPASFSSGPMLTPAMGFGGIAGGNIGLQYYIWNFTTAAWVLKDLAASGSGCTISGTANDVIFVNTGGSTCTSSPDFVYNPSTQNLNVIGSSGTAQALTLTGYGLASDGWNTGTCGLQTCFNSLDGGATVALGVSAGEAFFPLGSASPAYVPGAGYGGIGYSGTGAVYNIWNGGSSPGWFTFDFTTGGGTGCTLGSTVTDSIVYVTSGPACAGSANFTYFAGQVTLTGGSFVTTGQYGFDASTCGASSYIDNCIQVPNGGVLGLGGTFGGPRGVGPIALAIVGTSGSGAGSSQRGSLAWDTAAGTQRWQAVLDTGADGDNNWGLYDNGASAYSITANYATGNIGIGTPASTLSGQSLYVLGAVNSSGITLLNGFITTIGGLISESANYNGVASYGGYTANANASAFGTLDAFTVCTSVNCSTGIKVIDDSGNVFANNLTVSGTCTGCGGGTNYWQLSGSTLSPISGSYGVQISAGSASVPGLTLTSAPVAAYGFYSGTSCTVFNCFQSYGGFAAAIGGATVNGLTVDGLAVIGPTGQFIAAAGISTSGGATFASAVNANGGLTTSSGSNSVLYIGTGELYLREAGIASGTVSCSGVTNGLIEVTTDNYLVVCSNTGTRYRTALASY